VSICCVQLKRHQREVWSRQAGRRRDTIIASLQSLKQRNAGASSGDHRLADSEFSIDHGLAAQLRSEGLQLADALKASLKQACLVCSCFAWLLGLQSNEDKLVAAACQSKGRTLPMHETEQPGILK
jgi:hypothetical protein